MEAKKGACKLKRDDCEGIVKLLKGITEEKLTFGGYTLLDTLIATHQNHTIVTVLKKLNLLSLKKNGQPIVVYLLTQCVSDAIFEEIISGLEVEDLASYTMLLAEVESTHPNRIAFLMRKGVTSIAPTAERLNIIEKIIKRVDDPELLAKLFLDNHLFNNLENLSHEAKQILPILFKKGWLTTLQVFQACKLPINLLIDSETLELQLYKLACKSEKDRIELLNYIQTSGVEISGQHNSIVVWAIGQKEYDFADALMKKQTYSQDTVRSTLIQNLNWSTLKLLFNHKLIKSEGKAQFLSTHQNVLQKICDERKRCISWSYDLEEIQKLIEETPYELLVYQNGTVLEEFVKKNAVLTLSVIRKMGIPLSTEYDGVSMLCRILQNCSYDSDFSKIIEELSFEELKSDPSILLYHLTTGKFSRLSILLKKKIPAAIPKSTPNVSDAIIKAIKSINDAEVVSYFLINNFTWSKLNSDAITRKKIVDALLSHSDKFAIDVLKRADFSVQFEWNGEPFLTHIINKHYFERDRIEILNLVQKEDVDPALILSAVKGENYGFAIALKQKGVVVADLNRLQSALKSKYKSPKVFELLYAFNLIQPDCFIQYLNDMTYDHADIFAVIKDNPTFAQLFCNWSFEERQENCLSKCFEHNFYPKITKKECIDFINKSYLLDPVEILQLILHYGFTSEDILAINSSKLAKLNRLPPNKIDLLLKSSEVNLDIVKVLLSNSSDPETIINRLSNEHLLSLSKWAFTTSNERILRILYKKGIYAIPKTLPAKIDFILRLFRTFKCEKLNYKIFEACQFTCDDLKTLVDGKSLLAEIATHADPKYLIRALKAQNLPLDACDASGKPFIHIITEHANQLYHFDIQELCLTDEELNIYDRDNNSLLHQALIKNYNYNAWYLVEKNIGIQAVNRSGQKPVHIGIAQCENMELVKSLIAKETDINLKDQQDQTLLHYAVAYGKPELVESLLSRGANQEIENKAGDLPIHAALKSKRHDIYKLLKTQLVVSDRWRHVSKTQNFLFCATEAGDSELVKELTTNGISLDVNYRDSEGNSHLHAAASQGLGELVAMLLRKGAECNAQNKYGATPLHLAAKNGKAASCLGLIESTNVAIQDVKGNTVLHETMACHDLESSNKLLARGASPSILNAAKKTPLHMLILARSAKKPHSNAIDSPMGIFKALRLKKEQWHIIDDEDNTLLHFAAQHSNGEVIQFLLEQGVEWAKQNRSKKTALHIALESMQKSTVKTLLKALKTQWANLTDADGNNFLHTLALTLCKVPTYYEKLKHYIVFLDSCAEELLVKGTSLNAINLAGKKPDQIFENHPIFFFFANILRMKNMSQKMNSSKSKLTSETSAAFKTLGISSDASMDEIKMAYRSQIKRFHPDKTSKLSVEQKEQCLEHSKQLTAAYAAACNYCCNKN